MSKEQAEAKLKAATWAIAAEYGLTEAIRLLEKMKSELSNQQWGDGPGSR